MRAQTAARRVRDCPGLDRQAPREVIGRLAARDKADLLALRLVRDRQAELSRVLPHLALGHPAQREHDARKTLAVQVIEHVRLVLRVIGGRVKLGAAGPVKDPRVVPRGEPVETQVDHPPEHQVEAHERVASDAWIGSTTREVRAVERLDHTLAELLLQVPAVIRNAEDGSDAARVLHRRERAAAPVACGFLPVVARPLLQRHADHVMALRLQQGGGDR